MRARWRAGEMERDRMGTHARGDYCCGKVFESGPRNRTPHFGDGSNRLAPTGLTLVSRSPSQSSTCRVRFMSLGEHLRK
jgi:hypothetical protein